MRWITHSLLACSLVTLALPAASRAGDTPCVAPRLSARDQSQHIDELTLTPIG